MRRLVLCYHAISKTLAADLAVTPAAFERQLRMLMLRRFRPGTVADVLDGSGRVFHVTFDDAFANVARILATLERFDIRPTVFACSDYARDGRTFAVAEVCEHAAAHPAEMRTMNWDELGALAERGVEIGSHTVTHPHLPQLSDAELMRELTEAKQAVEDHLGRPCRYVAYPYGDDDARVYAAADRASYDAGFSLVASRSSSVESRFGYPRVDLYRKDGLLRAFAKTASARGRKERPPS